MENKKFSAKSVAVHGAAIQQCLNGALVSVQDFTTGQWQPFSNGDHYNWSPEFSYRTKMSPGSPALESPGVENVEVREEYKNRGFEPRQLRAHGAVIQWYLRGGEIEFRLDEEDSWTISTEFSTFAFCPGYEYRIVEQRCEVQGPPEKLAPPLGIEPEYIWVEKRIAELKQAIIRQCNRTDEPNWELVLVWVKEMVRRNIK